MSIVKLGGLQLRYSGLPLWLEWDKRLRVCNVFYDVRVWQVPGEQGSLVTIENKDWQGVPEACEEIGWQWHRFPSLIIANPGEHGIDAATFKRIEAAIEASLPPARTTEPRE